MSHIPGQNVQEIYLDPKTGVRYDGASGRPITMQPQSFDPNEIAYYSSVGQPLRYVDVYPGPVNVHQNKALTDVAVSFELDQSMFIGPEIAPVKTVAKRSDIYYKVARGDVTRDYGSALEKPIGSVANKVQQGFDTDNYLAVQYALRDFIPDKVASNADEALQLATRTTEFLQQVLDLGWDRRLVTNMLSNTTDFTNVTFTAAGGGKVGAATEVLRYIQLAINSANINVMRANNAKAATHLVMSADVAQTIAASPEIASIVKHQMGVNYIQNGGWAGGNYGLPEILYGKKVVVLPHVNNTAAKGQTDVFADLLTDIVSLFRVEPPSVRTTNTVTTFRVEGIRVKTYRDEAAEGTWVEVIMDQDEKITNVNGGYLMTDAL